MTAEPSRAVFTIGHSNHSLEGLLELLGRHEVTAVADVRSSPYSRLHPAFNREGLAAALQARGLAYVYVGKELGARSSDPSYYQNGVVQYRLLARTELFRSGLARVLRGAESNRLVLLCAEKEPVDCHRAILVARELEALGAKVVHIHADGHLESHTDAVARLLVKFGLGETELFRSRDEVIDDAYARQERRIAYAIKDDDEGPREDTA